MVGQGGRGFALLVGVTREVFSDEMTGEQGPEQANYSHLIMGGNAGSTPHNSLGSTSSIGSI